VGGGVALSLWLGSPFGMAWANFLPLGAPVILIALARAGAGRELALLTRQLAGVFVVPLVPFAAAWFVAGDDRWLRLALTLVAALLALAWTWYRHGEDFREFFRGPKAPGPTPALHLEAQ